jgi:hypothetical protein
MAIDYALRMLQSLRSLFEIVIFLSRLNISYLVIFFFQKPLFSPFGGLNEPFV